MAKRNISNCKQEVASIYRTLSKAAIQTGDGEVTVKDLRAALEKADIVVTNKDGTPKGPQALRLSVNKAVGDIVRAGVGTGKFKSLEDGKQWKKERFLRITSAPVIEGVDDIIDDLD